MAYVPDLAVDGSLDAIKAFLEAAEAAGVKTIVLLSGRGEPEAQACEDELMGRGFAWTILRCSWFAQNFSESIFLDGVLSGDVALPADATPEPFVDAEDIADVAFAALTEDGHAGEVYELTGPRSLRMDEAVAELAIASGRPLTFRRVTPEEYSAAAPPELAEFVVFLFTELLDGRNAEPQDGVFRALGRAPRDFGEFARRTAATGVWA